MQYYTIAIVVPLEEEILEYAKSRGIEGTYEQLCKNKEVIEEVHSDITRHGKEAKLFSFELAKKIHLEPRKFMDNDFITPSLKLKRHLMTKHYDKVIKRMYEEPLIEKKESRTDITQ